MPETANSALVDIVREVRVNIKELNKTINQQNNIISDLNFHIEDKVRIIKAAEKCINDQTILINKGNENIKYMEEIQTQNSVKLNKVMLLNYDLELATRKKTDEIEELKTKIEKLEKYNYEIREKLEGYS